MLQILCEIGGDLRRYVIDNDKISNNERLEEGYWWLMKSMTFSKYLHHHFLSLSSDRTQ